MSNGPGLLPTRVQLLCWNAGSLCEHVWLNLSFLYTHTLGNLPVCVCVCARTLSEFMCVCCYSKQTSSFLTSLFCAQCVNWLTARVTVLHSSLTLFLSLNLFVSPSLFPWQLAVTKTLHSPRTWDQEEGSILAPPMSNSTRNSGRQTHIYTETPTHTPTHTRWIRGECCRNLSTWPNKYDIAKT